MPARVHLSSLHGCPDRPGHGHTFRSLDDRLLAPGEHGPRHSGRHQSLGECTDTAQRHTGRVSPERFLGWRTSGDQPEGRGFKIRNTKVQ
jgi:hypothetical protein